MKLDPQQCIFDNKLANIRILQLFFIYNLQRALCFYFRTDHAYFCIFSGLFNYSYQCRSRDYSHCLCNFRQNAEDSRSYRFGSCRFLEISEHIFILLLNVDSNILVRMIGTCAFISLNVNRYLQHFYLDIGHKIWKAQRRSIYWA